MSDPRGYSCRYTPLGDSEAGTYDLQSFDWHWLSDGEMAPSGGCAARPEVLYSRHTIARDTCRCAPEAGHWAWGMGGGGGGGRVRGCVRVAGHRPVLNPGAV